MTRSRGSFFAGVLASMALHAAILLPWLLGGGATTAPPSPGPVRPMVAVLPLPLPLPEPEPQADTKPPAPPEPEPAEPEPPVAPPPAPPAETVTKPAEAPPAAPVETASVPPQEPQEAPPQAAPPPPPPPAAPAPEVRMSAVVEPPAAPDSGPGLAASAPNRGGDDSDDGLPPMRIMWDSPRQLADVAAALGMRVVAVTDKNEVAGEVPLNRPYKLEPFNGELVVYSNRVRTLPLSYFGAGLVAATEEPIAAYWVLVPQQVDRQFADLVRAALKRAGLPAAQVQWVETRFTLEGARQYRLEIVKIHQERRT